MRDLFSFNLVFYLLRARHRLPAHQGEDQARPLAQAREARLRLPHRHGRRFRGAAPLLPRARDAARQELRRGRAQRARALPQPGRLLWRARAAAERAAPQPQGQS